MNTSHLHWEKATDNLKAAAIFSDLQLGADTPDVDRKKQRPPQTAFYSPACSQQAWGTSRVGVQTRRHEATTRTTEPTATWKARFETTAAVTPSPVQGAEQGNMSKNPSEPHIRRPGVLLTLYGDRTAHTAVCLSVSAPLLEKQPRHPLLGLPAAMPAGGEGLK